MFTLFSYSIYPLLRKIYTLTINLFWGDGNIGSLISDKAFPNLLLLVMMISPLNFGALLIKIFIFEQEAFRI